MSTKSLYVGNLSYDTTEDGLRGHFDAWGPVTEVRLIGQRGFGFVEIPAEKAAEAAVGHNVVMAYMAAAYVGFKINNKTSKDWREWCPEVMNHVSAPSSLLMSMREAYKMVTKQLRQDGHLKDAA